MVASVMSTLVGMTTTTLADKARQLLDAANETLDNSTTILLPTTTTTTFVITNSTTTAGPSTMNFTKVTTTKPTIITTITTTIPSTSTSTRPVIPEPSTESYHLLAVFVTALFIATVLLIVKVIASHNNKRRIVMNWWHPTSPSHRRSGPAAIYTAAGDSHRQVSSMDVPDSRFDWERQFFDEDAYSQSREFDADRTRARLQLLSDP